MGFTFTSENGTVVNSLLSDAATLHLKFSGLPTPAPTLTGSILDAKGNKSGYVLFPNGETPDGNDKLDVKPVAFKSGSLKLHLEDANDASNFYELDIDAVVSSRVEFVTNPGNVNEPDKGVVITARITNDQKIKQPGGLSLTYEAASAADNPFFRPPQLQQTLAGDDASFSYTTEKVTAAELTAMEGIGFNLQIGPAGAQVAVTQLIPFRTLQPPKLLITDHGKITDTIVAGLPQEGLPVNIPIINDAQAYETYVFLYAHAIPGTETDSARQQNEAVSSENPVWPERDILLDWGTVVDESKPLRLFIRPGSEIFEQGNKTYDIYYEVVKESGNQNVSLGVKVPVDLHKYGGSSVEIDYDLRPAIPQPIEYTNKQYAKNDKLVVTVAFDGRVQPTAGDKVQPYLDLVGCTLANRNQFIRIKLEEYTITPADIVDGQATIVYGDDSGTLAAYQPEDLHQREASNGDLYYIHTTTDGKVRRSPPRPVFVDTVSPYSAITNSRLVLAQRFLKKQP
ncbi:hypothetical protein [Bordetella genomosp. 9]|uniref:Uncharacterized protein n=1 Tax=Bordetella genomosp. 9 TaxID=1416803 RepID=A0A1W6Z3K6_9BORD|nr:hypothetical protein [Bordetella genomosp. 9]ARP87940.1 hypothetical protein CAL13_18265 [Bordetella genomosp. 9]